MTRAAVLAGLGAYLPTHVLTNDMLAQTLDTSDAWIRSRTGIGERHIVAEDQTTADLAKEAGQRAMASAGVTRVDAVVLATTTPDLYCPATAPTVAAKLGLAGTPAFDVSAACTGFIYGLTVASSLIKAGVFESVLFIGADTFTQTLDPTDRSTRALIGDGAGAVVLRAGEASEDGAILAFDLGSDGNQVDLLYVPGRPRADRANGQAHANGYFQMNGRAVFTEAVTHMSESVERVLKKVEWPLADVDYLVPHQANARILASVADQLSLDASKVISNIADVGNTVAASIPLAIAHHVKQKPLERGAKVVLTGFGAGLTWGSIAFRWPAIAVHQ